MMECPVCLNVMVNPKVLFCGHCVCEECERKMLDKDARLRPYYRRPSLKEMIEHAQQKKKKAMEGPDKMPYVCVPCGKKTGGADEMWLCKDCNSMFVCSVCAFKAHRYHEVTAVDELIDQRKKQVTAWKEQVLGRVEEMVVGRNTAVRNASEAERQLAYMSEYVDNIQQWISATKRSLDEGLTAFRCSFFTDGKCSRYASMEDELVGEDEQVGIEQLQPKLEAKVAEMNTFVDRNKSLTVTSGLLCDMIDTFKTGVRRMDACIKEPEFWSVDDNWD